MKHFTLVNYTKRACIALLGSAIFLLEACAPSAAKIEEAKTKYAELAKIHNAAVEAHKNITDAALDSSLSELASQVALLKDFNLHEMREEEIDTMIASMDNIISSYQEDIETMKEIKESEDAAVLTPIILCLVNSTKFSFTSLSLYEEGTYESHVNILSGLAPFTPSQAITGLTIERDVDQTPWILSFETEDGTAYDITLPVSEYSVEGAHLLISYDSETSSLVAIDSANSDVPSEDVENTDTKTEDSASSTAEPSVS